MNPRRAWTDGRHARVCKMEGKRLALALLGRNHDAKDPFGGHSVTARMPVGEEVTAAVPGASIERDCMTVIFALESCLKSCELDALGLFRILLCFGNLPDHAGVHTRYPLSAIHAHDFMCRGAGAASRLLRSRDHRGRL